MFKRVEKRRRKKEEEEELGLDEDMKEVLGMHDTDSEESASDSDDLSDDAESSNDERVSSRKGAFKEEAVLDQVEDDSETEEEQPMITVQEALRDPLYLVSLEPVMKACIVCPGKHLKGAKMVDLHQTSNACTAHERRVKLFKTLASRAKPQDNAWDLLREYTEKKSPPSLAAPSEDSKRAQKRKAHAALRKARRDKQKAKTKRTAGAKPSSSEPRTTSPPPKKPKITTPAPAPGSPMQTPRETASVSIQSITRSASGRAKMARARAANIKAKRNPKVAAS